MAIKNIARSKKMQQTLALYNMIPNLIWSIINLAPIFIFCFTLVSHKAIYIFLTFSSIPIFMKNSFLDNMQIGTTTKIYKKFRIDVINRFAQNGTIVNRLMKKEFPEYKNVVPKKSSIAALIKQSYMFEKFHWILFMFFSFTIVYASMNNHLYWAVALLMNNILYNIYPNFLQQYIRLKLKLYSERIKKYE